MDLSYRTTRPSPAQSFAGVVLTWSVVAVLLLGALSPASAFLVWFAGVHVAVELLPLSRIPSGTRRTLRRLMAVGYAAVAVVVYLYFVPL